MTSNISIVDNLNQITQYIQIIINRRRYFRSYEKFFFYFVIPKKNKKILVAINALFYLFRSYFVTIVALVLNSISFHNSSNRNFIFCYANLIFDLLNLVGQKIIRKKGFMKRLLLTKNKFAINYLRRHSSFALQRD